MKNQQKLIRPITYRQSDTDGYDESHETEQCVKAAGLATFLTAHLVEHFLRYLWHIAEVAERIVDRADVNHFFNRLLMACLRFRPSAR